MIISALSEIIAVASIVPFINIISANPSVPSTSFGGIHQLMGYFYFKGGIVAYGVLAILLVAISAALNAYNLWLHTRTSALIGSDLSVTAFTKILHASFIWHKKQSAPQITSTLTAQTSRTVTAINSLLELISSSTTTIAILCFLFVVDWKATLLAIVSLTISYRCVSKFAEKRVLKNSYLITKGGENWLRAIGHSLGSIREIKLQNLYSIEIDQYRNIDRSVRVMQSQNTFHGKYPRYLFEFLGITLIISLTISLSVNNDPSRIFPVLGVFVLSAQRLLPSSQKVYGNIVSIKGCSADVESLSRLLDSQPEFIGNKTTKAFPPYSNINLKNLSFKYENTHNVLDQISLKINAGEIIGIVGESGSGKTTLIDIFSTLIQPSNGQILVDNIDVNNDSLLRRSWRRSLSYIPQDIYLLDGTIKHNIVFGSSAQEIDSELLRQSVVQANLSEFIDSLPGGLDYKVGDCGRNLSGGQRQRLIIARAFYQKSRLLLVDEATSALDGKSESEVMQSIYAQKGKITVLIIAHRLETLHKCDRVIWLGEGRLLSVGTPSKVLQAYKGSIQ